MGCICSLEAHVVMSLLLLYTPEVQSGRVEVLQPQHSKAGRRLQNS